MVRQNEDHHHARKTAPVHHPKGLQRRFPRERHLRAADRRQRPGGGAHLVADPACPGRFLASAFGEAGNRLLKRFVAQEHPGRDCGEYRERCRQAHEIRLRPGGKERLHQRGGWPEHDPRRDGLGDAPNHERDLPQPGGQRAMHVERDCGGDDRRCREDRGDRQPRHAPDPGTGVVEPRPRQGDAREVDLRGDHQDPRADREPQPRHPEGRGRRHGDDQRAEQDAELRSQHAMNQQLAPRHRRGKQELQFRVGELEQAAVDRHQPGSRRHHQQRNGAEGGQQRDHRDHRLRPVGRPRPAARGTPRDAEAREEAEIDVGRADDRADQIPRLAQPAQPHAHPVSRAADDDVEAS